MADGDPICGRPLRYYKLSRPRSDIYPVCHRRPGHNGKCLSWAAMERNRQNAAAWREQNRGPAA